ncbi:MAG: phosphomethylpyrimidine synthase ThiC [Verrucomicrobiota bacterium]|nr:phosphomethylpyrimidine synthase ThiC [Verrucomicrobiota bacterium]
MGYKTQLEAAKKGILTEEMRNIAEKEYLSTKLILSEVASGRIVIPANHNHKNLLPIGIGKSLRTKINANIGNSSESSCVKEELQKLELAVKYGSDTVMDLSTGEGINEIRKAILDASTVPIGTVPIYQALALVDDPMDLTAELLLDVIREQAEQGVDYMTLHAGLLKEHVAPAKKRLGGIVSRGGAILAKWMMHHNKENLLYTHFDEVLEIAKEFDVTLSLGDGLRPGCLADASDAAQFAELAVLGELVVKSRAANVQVMVEGPGHIPMDEIEMNMKREDELCDGAPFYILGPVVIDCAPGYDHISSAIGAAMGAFYGASMLCYVTPKEHLGLPGPNDVREGVIAYKIAAHAADIGLKRPRAREVDDKMAHARVDFDWEKQFSLALDPERAREYRKQSFADIQEKNNSDNTADSENSKDQYCTMCGPKFCSMHITKEI